MSRPRKPTALLELNGAFRKDPKRGRARASEPIPTGPLGDAPKYFSKRVRDIWNELASLAPAGVLTNADRWLAETTCLLMAKQRRYGIGGRDGIATGELSILNQCLIRIGLTPADRSKVSVPKRNDAPNPFSELVDEVDQTTKRVN